MSILNTLGNGIAGPFKAIGHAVQGKFRRAVGDLGDTAKLAAIPVGVVAGPGAGAAVGGIGGAASKWGNGDSNIGHILASGAGGAAVGAASGFAKPLFAAGGPLSLGGGVGGGGAISAPLTAEEAGGGALSHAAGGIGARLMASATSPQVITGALGTAANVYGGSQEGAAMDRQQTFNEEQARIQEEDRQKRLKLDQLGTVMNGMANFRPRY